MNAITTPTANNIIQLEKLASLESTLNEIGKYYLAKFLFLLQKEKLFLKNDSLNFDAVSRAISVTEAHSKQLNCLLNALAALNHLQIEENNCYKLNKQFNLTEKSTQEAIEALVAKQPELKIPSEFLETLLTKYLAILSEKQSFLNCLFPEGSFKIINQLYKTNAIANFYNTLTANSILSHAKPKGAILEVGAGIGSISELILPALEQGDHENAYYYTDISPAFLNYGKRTYGSLNKNLHFKKFNLDLNPLEQGFHENQFDLICATNALHIAKNVTKSLAELRSLLKPGGKLILNEPIRNNTFSTLVFGLAPGWHNYQNNDYRIDNGPIINTRSWIKLLNETGWSQAKALLNPNQHPIKTNQEILLATRP